ncbi:hypothetical protein [Williamsia sp. CHRR-6]|uniref:hypothetical protein n=1 Tax=Williamsia sp. CHRR-6 TaxID=2835871 RepID=UPI001BDB4580|nr:hypothetical protein [Williamsia sp. CHRR-6]MBT0566766.1 hypothetical protein [Williamsia sp. CHRR-6]
MTRNDIEIAAYLRIDPMPFVLQDGSTDQCLSGGVKCFVGFTYDLFQRMDEWLSSKIEAPQM